MCEQKRKELEKELRRKKEQAAVPTNTAEGEHKREEARQRGEVREEERKASREETSQEREERNKEDESEKIKEEQKENDKVQSEEETELKYGRDIAVDLVALKDDFTEGEVIEEEHGVSERIGKIERAADLESEKRSTKETHT